MISPITFLRDRRWLFAYVASLVVLAALFVGYMHGPHMQGDSQSYLEAMDVLAGQAPQAGFAANRIITTFGALEIVRMLSPLFGGCLGAWFFMDLVLYLVACIVFYGLIKSFFQSESTAYLGGLFVAGNYGFYIFSLNRLMDIGGWSFYIFSIYFLFKYSQSKVARYLWLSALMVGIGGLFKEYAFLAAVAIAVYLIVEAWPILKSATGWKSFSKKALGSASLALIPAIILYVWTYNHFNYSYADWFGANAEHYIYNSRIIEYIKSTGSLVNVLAFLFIGGAIIAFKKRHELDREAKAFLLAVLVSFLPIFCWPAITQRILTITIPFIVIIACFLFKKYESRWYFFLPILILYILATLFMDSYVLRAVNLPL